jgi:hypothetical protein
VRELVFVGLTACSFFSGIGHADRTSPFAEREDCRYTRRSLIADIVAVGVSASTAAVIDRRAPWWPIPVPEADEVVGGVYAVSAAYGLYAIHACHRDGDAIWPASRKR